MKKITKLIIFVMAIAFISTFTFVSAKASDNTNIKNKLYVKLLNTQVSTNTSEVIVEIKNNGSKVVQLKNMVLTNKYGFSMSLPCKKVKIKNGKVKYINILFNQQSGEYKLNFIFNKKVVKNINLSVEKAKEPTNENIDDNNKNQDKDNQWNNNEDPNKNHQDNVRDYTSKTTDFDKEIGDLSEILLNRDFRISKNGRSNVVIFSENNYRDTYKTKIKVVIKRKTKKGFKVCKKFIKTKNSNIAFLNKTFKLNKKGKYQMFVRITRYKKFSKRTVKESSTYLSKIVKYK